MSDIDIKIHNWCRAVHPFGRNRHEKISELKDHLYCAIDRLCEDGMTQSQAYLSATAQMGSIGVLKNEHTKNISIMAIYHTVLFQKKDKLAELKTAIDPRKVIRLNFLSCLIFFATWIFVDLITAGSQFNDPALFSLSAIWVIWQFPMSKLVCGLVGFKGGFKLEYSVLRQEVSNLFHRG